jgi:hypothetical protein
MALHGLHTLRPLLCAWTPDSAHLEPEETDTRCKFIGTPLYLVTSSARITNRKTRYLAPGASRRNLIIKATAANDRAAAFGNGGKGGIDEITRVSDELEEGTEEIAHGRPTTVYKTCSRMAIGRRSAIRSAQSRRVRVRLWGPRGCSYGPREPGSLEATWLAFRCQHARLTHEPAPCRPLAYVYAWPDGGTYWRLAGRIGQTRPGTDGSFC